MPDDTVDIFEIEAPEILGVNKLPPRNASWPAPDVESGWSSSYDSSPWLASLNSQTAWAFSWSNAPQGRPCGFYRLDYDAEDWPTLPVPACWEMHGYGTPIYTNYCYPFKADPPRVMEEPPEHYTTYKERNAVGSYRRWFEVPEQWPSDDNGRVLLHFAGVSSAFYVWVNGQRVGYSQDSRSPAEFDITDYLRPSEDGPNLLAVEVYRFCAGSYLEDQDMWRLSGIFRDVFLYRTPATTLWDFFIESVLSADLTEAELKLHTTLRHAHPRVPPLRLRLHLRDPDGASVTDEPVIDDRVRDRTGVTMKGIVRKPLLWSHEHPQVYSALVELLDEDSGETLETRRVEVGFRRLEVVGQELCLNGHAIKIKGINRHESNPRTGYVVSAEDMEKDIRFIKQANFNFVRTAHYPNDPRWYTLCNQYGLLVMDEANIESHGLSYHKRVLPGDDPVWAQMCVDRIRSMVIRDRGHPCVAMWSLGNEAGYGDSFYRMREEVLALDPEQRLIQYADMNLAADVDSQTYPTPEWLEQHANGVAVRKGEHGELGSPEQHGVYPSGRPFLTNEYAHAHGNSLGNFKEYWDIFEAHPALWGGFIWDWADQTLLKQDADGQWFHAYGGDFGDQPNDGRFCFNGLVSAEREPHPHYWEARKVQQFIKIEATAEELAAGNVRIKNTFTDTSLSEFTGQWNIERDGFSMAQGNLPEIAIGPGESVIVSLAIPESALCSGKHEHILTITFSRKSACRWAPKGHVVAWEQFPLTALRDREIRLPSPGDGSTSCEVTDTAFMLSAAQTEVRIDRGCGLMRSLRLHGVDYLCGSLVPCFWRVPTDNDIGWKVPESMSPWKQAPDAMRLESLDHESHPDAELVTVNLGFHSSALAGVNARFVYRLLSDGRLIVTFKLTLPDCAPELARIGLQFSVPEAFSQTSWFGRGPHENYCDRKSGSAIAVHELGAAEWGTPYARPQENAHRSDIRWLELRSKGDAGRQLKISAVGSRLFGASIWTCQGVDLERTEHAAFLPVRDSFTLTLSGWQMGVGGNNSWGEPVLPQYRIPVPGEYEFGIELAAGDEHR